MKARPFLAVVLAVALSLLSLGIGGWWFVLQHSPLQLQNQALVVPAAARFVPRLTPLSLYWLADPEQPVVYARAVAPSRQRRVAADTVALLRDGAFAAAGIDYATELASWIGPETSLAIIALAIIAMLFIPQIALRGRGPEAKKDGAEAPATASSFD